LLGLDRALESIVVRRISGRIGRESHNDGQTTRRKEGEQWRPTTRAIDLVSR
jgi:hypothetical protein